MPGTAIASRMPSNSSTLAVTSTSAGCASSSHVAAGIFTSTYGVVTRDPSFRNRYVRTGVLALPGPVPGQLGWADPAWQGGGEACTLRGAQPAQPDLRHIGAGLDVGDCAAQGVGVGHGDGDEDRKSTRLNSSHVKISYAVFCLKKK